MMIEDNNSPKMGLMNPEEVDQLDISLQYLYVPELKELSLQLGLLVRGKKPDYIENIKTYLTTRQQVLRSTYPAISCAQKGQKYPLAPETLVLYKSYKNDLRTRDFMKMLVGPHFHFAVFGFDWMRKRWREGNPPTYQEYAQFWQQEYVARQNRRSPLKKEWAYLNFSRTFLDQYPHSSKKELLNAWNKERIRHKEIVLTMIEPFLK